MRPALLAHFYFKVLSLLFVFPSSCPCCEPSIRPGLFYTYSIALMTLATFCDNHHGLFRITHWHYRYLYMPNYPNLLVAGRCLSAERTAFASVRVQAPAMATGQAAGCAAVLCALDGYTALTLSPAGLQARLREQYAIFLMTDLPQIATGYFWGLVGQPWAMAIEISFFITVQ